MRLVTKNHMLITSWFVFCGVVCVSGPPSAASCHSLLSQTKKTQHFRSPWRCAKSTKPSTAIDDLKLVFASPTHFGVWRLVLPLGTLKIGRKLDNLKYPYATTKHIHYLHSRWGQLPLSQKSKIWAKLGSISPNLRPNLTSHNVWGQIRS